MSSITSKQAMWAKLQGIQDPEVKKYWTVTPSKKYVKIDLALQLHPEVSVRPVKAVRSGPGSTAKDWVTGVAELAKFMPRRPRTIANSLNDIEMQLKKKGHTITWGKMTWMYKFVYTRYHEDINLGADVMIEGKTDKGMTVNYWYDNTTNAEGAHRYMIVNGKKENI